MGRDSGCAGSLVFAGDNSEGRTRDAGKTGPAQESARADEAGHGLDRRVKIRGRAQTTGDHAKDGPGKPGALAGKKQAGQSDRGRSGDCGTEAGTAWKHPGARAGGDRVDRSRQFCGSGQSTGKAIEDRPGKPGAAGAEDKAEPVDKGRRTGRGTTADDGTQDREAEGADRGPAKRGGCCGCGKAAAGKRGGVRRESGHANAGSKGRDNQDSGAKKEAVDAWSE